MKNKDVYVGLGGNIGDSLSVLKKGIEEIKRVKGIHDIITSKFYLTTPVSTIPQDKYVNAVCRFKSSLDLRSLFNQLQQIETKLGKMAKAKDAPRMIDLDILLFGDEICCDHDLKVPHVDWMNRLFVLVPLLDVVQTINVPDPKAHKGYQTIDLIQYIKTFNNRNCETVTLIQE